MRPLQPHWTIPPVGPSSISLFVPHPHPFPPHPAPNMHLEPLPLGSSGGPGLLYGQPLSHGRVGMVGGGSPAACFGGWLLAQAPFGMGMSMPSSLPSGNLTTLGLKGPQSWIVLCPKPPPPHPPYQAKLLSNMTLSRHRSLVNVSLFLSLCLLTLHTQWDSISQAPLQLDRDIWLTGF